MIISNTGLKLIKKFARYSSTPFKSPEGKLKIGYDHTGKGTREQKIDETRAYELLIEDCSNAAQAIKEAVKVDLNQNQFDALVSFVFSEGAQAFKKSTLLRELNQGHYHQAYLEFNKWVYSGEQMLVGLVKRRREESNLFLAK